MNDILEVMKPSLRRIELLMMKVKIIDYQRSN